MTTCKRCPTEKLHRKFEILTTNARAFREAKTTKEAATAALLVTQVIASEMVITLTHDATVEDELETETMMHMEMLLDDHQVGDDDISVHEMFEAVEEALEHGAELLATVARNV